MTDEQIGTILLIGLSSWAAYLVAWFRGYKAGVRYCIERDQLSQVREK